MATYYGGSNNDSLNGSSGNDVAYGYGGSDTLYGGGGSDSAYGGDGNDSGFGGTGYDTLYGDAGNDTLSGDAGYDSLFGGAGDDLLKGANDIYDDFYGGDGNDTILAGDFAEDWAWGDAGNDVIYTGGGSDIAWGGTGADTLYGGGGSDQLHGNAGTDSLLGDVGSDTLSGGSGNDTLDGGAENDTVLGGTGRDSLFGGSGDDLIRGDSDSFDGFDASYGPTDTTLTVTNAASFAVSLYWIDTSASPVLMTTLQPGQSWSGSTGTTHNWYLADTASGNVVEVIYGAANQTVTFTPPFDDTISGGDGNDTIFGDYGNDSILGDAGNDSLTTGTGNDTVYGGDGKDSASLGDGDDSFGFWGGELGDDSIDGGLGHDSIIAGAGNDTVQGGGGNDWLTGASGFDTLYGGQGNDSFAITDDHQGDTIYGGENTGDQDLITFANYTSTQGVAVTFSGNEAGSYDFAGTDGAGSFAEIEGLSGTAYGDTINASLTTGGTVLYTGAGADSLTGGSGADTLYFGSGADTVYGGDGADLMDDTANAQDAGANLIDAGGGNDTVWSGGDADTVSGGTGNDALYGEGGGDSLSGGAGHDWIQGDDGNDTLTGGTGDDSLYGGTGNDVFQIAQGDGVDALWAGEESGDFDTVVFSGGTAGVSVLYTGAETASFSYNGINQGSFFQIEALQGTTFGDTVNASASSSGVSIAAGDGADVVLGGSGADLIAGGAGNDILSGGAGFDTLTGGDGADRFDLLQADTGDRITDFNLTLTNSRTEDQLDVSALQNAQGAGVKAWDVSVTDDGHGNTLLTFPQGESLVLQGVSPAQVSSPGMLAAMGVPCFVAGTRIATPDGPRRVETLVPGDRVVLATGGSAPVLWHGQRSLSAAELASQPGWRPVCLKAGHHGATADLFLSPQHAVAVDLPEAGRALIRASHLAAMGWGARIALGQRKVTYHHLLLPQHSLLLAEGVVAESLYPGPQALLGFSPFARASLLRVMTSLCPPLPGLNALTAYGGRCLPILSRRQALTLRQPNPPWPESVSANSCACFP